jgi:membrane protease YdiL (CAAX protease family)
LTPAGGDRRGTLKAIAWSIAFLFFSLLLATFLSSVAAIAIAGPGAGRWLQTGGAGALLVQGVAALVSAGFFTGLIGVRVNGLTRQDLRYPDLGLSISGFGWGLTAGMLAAFVALALAVAIGGAGWAADRHTSGSYLAALVRTVVLLAPAALAEELLFRGVPLVLLSKRFGRGTALVVVAAAFALVHAKNPNVTPLGIGNVALAGVFLGLVFYSPGGIWAAIGAHLGWNATLAALDAPVSGLPFQMPALDYHPGHPTWLTGGPFGPEGGVSATLALGAACAAVARRIAAQRAGP